MALPGQSSPNVLRKKRQKNVPSPEEINNPQKDARQTYSIPGTGAVSKEEYNAYKATTGFQGGAGPTTVTPRVQQAINEGKTAAAVQEAQGKFLEEQQLMKLRQGSQEVTPAQAARLQEAQQGEAPTEPFTFSDAVQGAAPNILAQGLQRGAITGAAAATPLVVASAGPQAAVTLPAAGVAGAVGFAAGALSAVYSEIAQEYQEERDVQYVEFTDSLRNLNTIIGSVNQGADPTEGRILFYNELQKIDATEKNLYALGEVNWLSKAKKKLEKIQNFNDVARADTIRKFEQAAAQPNSAAGQAVSVPQEFVNG